MEEDIKKIEYFLNQADEYYDGNIDIKDCVITKEVAEVIKNLIKGYKELEEKNAVLRKANNIAKDVKIEDITNFVDKSIENFNNEYLPKSKVREKIEERYGTLCMELGSYVRDEATSEQERIAGGINELRKLKKELLQ